MKSLSNEIPESDYIVDLLSKRLKHGLDSERLTDLECRIMRLIDTVPLGTLIPQSQFQSSIWGHGEKVLSETYRMLVGRLLRKSRKLRGPVFLVRQRGVGWRRTDATIAIINPPPETPAHSEPLLLSLLPEEITHALTHAITVPGGEALSPAMAAMYRELRLKRVMHPLVMVGVIDKWQYARELARENKWAFECEIDIARLLDEMGSPHSRFLSVFKGRDSAYRAQIEVAIQLSWCSGNQKYK